MTLRPTIGANHADGDVVTSAEWNNDVVQQGNWVQEVLTGVNSDKIPASAISGTLGYYPNLLVNGGMEVSQRGTSAFTASGTAIMTVDRWACAVVPPASMAVQQLGTSSADTGSSACGVMNYTHSSGCYGVLMQKVENYLELRGRLCYLTARVYWTGAANSAYAQLADGVTAQNSGYAINNGLYNTISVSITPSASATKLSIAFYTIGTGLLYIDNVMLCAAPQAVNYTPRPYGEEFALCQRYYQNTFVATHWFSSPAGGDWRDSTVFYPQAMPASPAPTGTLTAGSRVNVASGLLLNIGTDSARAEYQSTAANLDTYAINESIWLQSFIDTIP